jgi:hypothetical protein
VENLSYASSVPGLLLFLPCKALISYGKGGDSIMKKLLGLFIASIFVFAVSAPIRAQESAKTKKPAKEVRWEGSVIRISTENSTMDVRVVGGTMEKEIHFDSATVWNSQYHGDKTVNQITASDVKEGDRVICVGKYNDKNEFVATTISKRLSHSPQ